MPFIGSLNFISTNGDAFRIFLYEPKNSTERYLEGEPKICLFHIYLGFFMVKMMYSQSKWTLSVLALQSCTCNIHLIWGFTLLDRKTGGRKSPVTTGTAGCQRPEWAAGVSKPRARSKETVIMMMMIITINVHWAHPMCEKLN